MFYYDENLSITSLLFAVRLANSIAVFETSPILLHFHRIKYDVKLLRNLRDRRKIFK